MIIESFHERMQRVLIGHHPAPGRILGEKVSGGGLLRTGQKVDVLFEILGFEAEDPGVRELGGSWRDPGRVWAGVEGSLEHA
jgi:hypothetical protein